jgi:hypothetical protein
VEEIGPILGYASGNGEVWNRVQTHMQRPPASPWAPVAFPLANQNTRPNVTGTIWTWSFVIGPFCV